MLAQSPFYGLQEKTPVKGSRGRRTLSLNARCVAMRTRWVEQPNASAKRLWLLSPNFTGIVEDSVTSYTVSGASSPWHTCIYFPSLLLHRPQRVGSSKQQFHLSVKELSWWTLNPGLVLAPCVWLVDSR